MPIVLLQSHLLLCEHSFCDVSVTLYIVSVTLSPRSSMYIRGLIPRKFAELAEAFPIDLVAIELSLILVIVMIPGITILITGRKCFNI